MVFSACKFKTATIELRIAHIIVHHSSSALGVYSTSRKYFIRENHNIKPIFPPGHPSLHRQSGTLHASQQIRARRLFFRFRLCRVKLHDRCQFPRLSVLYSAGVCDIAARGTDISEAPTYIGTSRDTRVRSDWCARGVSNFHLTLRLAPGRECAELTCGKHGT